jgi:predicted enzyme related to lactoylglutathione lyase
MLAKLIFLEVFTRDSKRAQDFYGALFGVQSFCLLPTDEVRTYFMPISQDGIDLHITDVVTDNPPRIVPYFAVDDLRGAMESLRSIGGEMIVEPFTTRVPREYYERFREKAARRLDQVDPSAKINDRLGEVALMLDPDGNPLGLMEIEDFVHYSYRWGKHRIPLTEDQFEDHMTALRLSQELLFDEKSSRKPAKKA